MFFIEKQMLNKKSDLILVPDFGANKQDVKNFN